VFTEYNSAELKFLTLVKGCTRLDRIWSHYITSELVTFKVTEEMQVNKSNWFTMRGEHAGLYVVEMRSGLSVTMKKERG
jgi:hypothetical protein